MTTTLRLNAYMAEDPSRPSTQLSSLNPKKLRSDDRLPLLDSWGRVNELWMYASKGLTLKTSPTLLRQIRRLCPLFSGVYS